MTSLRAAKTGTGLARYRAKSLLGSAALWELDNLDSLDQLHVGIFKYGGLVGTKLRGKKRGEHRDREELKRE